MVSKKDRAARYSVSARGERNVIFLCYTTYMQTGSATSLVVLILILLGIFVGLALKPSDSLPPIIDPTCEPGYTLVGEGCMPNADVCQLQGDGYVFDEATQDCVLVE